jgi:cytochrome b6-f complex iron-sulfur subunit
MPASTMLPQQPRRKFLKYSLGGALGSIAWGFLNPLASQGREASLEALCAASPHNSRCKDHLPGVAARDRSNAPILAQQLLSGAKPGIPVQVQGLPRKQLAYLVIGEGPKLAEYALRSVCPHLGCAVNWSMEKKQFICPCHGSQFDNQGLVTKGPAKKSLSLLTVVVKQDQVRLVDRAPASDPRLGS